jgi:hypothetical protein
MSPESSQEYDQYDIDDTEYRGVTPSDEAPPIRLPKSMPARGGCRRRTSRGKSNNPATKTGFQRRRNKRFGL